LGLPEIVVASLSWGCRPRLSSDAPSALAPWRPNLPDESDNHLIELAVAGGARAIVTNNVRHLERSELLFPTIRILRPADLIEETKT